MTLSDFVVKQLLELAYAVTFCSIIYTVVSSSIYIFFAGIVVLYACLKAIRRNLTGTVAVNRQGIFITGCDTGFGHDVAKRLDKLGFTVFAGCLYPNREGARKLKSFCSRSLHIVPLDVGEDESVRAVHEYIIKHLPKTGLWAIVNNAGFNVMGDVEWLTVNLYHKVMNVNFLGAVRTIRTFLYLVRKTKGRVVNVSSVRGVISYPCDSAYHASKHALETMTDSLRLEMQEFEIKVAIVRLGNFGNATGSRNPEHYNRYRDEADEMWQAASDDIRRTYGREYLDGNVKAAEEHTRLDGSPTTCPVIDAIVHAITSEHPNTTYLVDGIRRGWIDSHAH